MNQGYHPFFQNFYSYLLNMTAANDAQRVNTPFLYHANTSTSSANFYVKTAAVVHHFTGSDPRITALSCISARPKLTF